MKKITLLVAGIIACSGLIAQQKRNAEISIWGSGGLSSLQSTVNIGEQKDKPGGAFGFGYNYYLSDKWSLGTGLEFAFYNADITQNSFNDVSLTNDGQNSFEYRTRISNRTEKQQAMYMHLLVMPRYELAVWSNHKLFIAAGFKVGFAPHKKFTIKNMSMYNRGFFPGISAPDEEIDEPEFKGFGNFEERNKKGDLDLKMSCNMNIEAGIKWKLPNSLSLYTGGYFEYGLNDIRKVKNNHLIEYNVSEPIDFIHTSSLSALYSAGNASDQTQYKRVTKSTHLMSFGAKISLAFAIH